MREGEDHKSYYHECFLRGRPDLTKFMTRLVNPGKRLPDPKGERNRNAAMLFVVRKRREVTLSILMNDHVVEKETQHRRVLITDFTSLYNSFRRTRLLQNGQGISFT